MFEIRDEMSGRLVADLPAEPLDFPDAVARTRREALLIAAAPELLEAYIDVEDCLNEGNRPLTCRTPKERLEEIEEWLDDEVLPKLRAAIAKAKGEA